MSFALLAASTAGDLVVDLAVGELVDLVVVLVTKTSAVGEVVDLCDERSLVSRHDGERTDWELLRV